MQAKGDEAEDEQNGEDEGGQVEWFGGRFHVARVTNCCLRLCQPPRFTFHGGELLVFDLFPPLGCEPVDGGEIAGEWVGGRGFHGFRWRCLSSALCGAFLCGVQLAEDFQ